MSLLLKEFSKKILYGLGFGSGMCIPYYFARKEDKNQIHLVKIIKDNSTIKEYPITFEYDNY